MVRQRRHVEVLTEAAKVGGAASFRAIDLDRQDPASRYKLLTGTVVPRPIALVSTLGVNGVVNLAPFSQFMIFAANPGLLGFSASEHTSGEKDTIRNLRQSGEMVINITSWSMAAQVQKCAEELSPDESEAELAGLGLMSSELVKPPRVSDAPVHFECELDQMIELGDIPNTIVVARVRQMHLREDIALPDAKIDTAALDPLGRIAGRNYCRVETVQTV